MKKTLFIVFVMATSSLLGQNYADTLTQKLTTISKNSDLAGFGVAVVGKDSIWYQKGFGYADLVGQSPYTSNTIHNIGSTSKTLIALALMQLVEQGKLQLEDDINDYLPFKIQNPHFPDSVITIRQLATHTSSLTDGEDNMVIEYSYLLSAKTDFKAEDFPEDYEEYYQIYNQNKSMSMGRFLHNTYCPDGDWYAETNFLKKAPGTTYEYSNIGATLLAYLIEEVAGEKFDTFTSQHILKPLNMQQSTWKLAEADTTQFASLYLSNGLQVPNYQLITYPDGGLITSISDFSLYLMEMLKGMAGESQLLQQRYFKEMMSNQLTTENFPNGDFETSKGMMWTVNREGDNIGANGADPGVSSYTLFTTAGNMGIVIFTNTSLYGNEDLERDIRRIRGTLFQYAGKLRKG